MLTAEGLFVKKKKNMYTSKANSISHNCRRFVVESKDGYQLSLDVSSQANLLSKRIYFQAKFNSSTKKIEL